MCLLGRTYHQDPMVIADTWPLAQCWAFAAWATENEPMADVERVGPGYVGQEINRRMTAANESRSS